MTTHTKEEIADDCEDLNYSELLVLHFLRDERWEYKTRVMNALIKEYGDIVDHGPYMGYGREYSDDIDEAFISMESWGALYTNEEGKFRITGYGILLHDCLMSGEWEWPDPKVNRTIERLKGAGE